MTRGAGRLLSREKRAIVKEVEEGVRGEGGERWRALLEGQAEREEQSVRIETVEVVVLQGMDVQSRDAQVSQSLLIKKREKDSLSKGRQY